MCIGMYVSPIIVVYVCEGGKSIFFSGKWGEKGIVTCAFLYACRDFCRGLRGTGMCV